MADPAPANTQVVVRTYPGKQPEAFAAFQHDAAQMAQAGWFPVAQQYVPGQWGCGAFLIAVLLFLVLVGILVFIYMLIVRPDGTLTVTYEYRGPTPNAKPVPPSTPATGLVGRLSQLDEAKAAGLISDEEYAARRAKILDTV